MAAPHPDINLNWAVVEPMRSRLHICGAWLVFLGCIGLFASWTWITCALAIGTGALLIDNFVSQERMLKKISGRVGCCGDEEAIKTERATDQCCCAPWHTVGLLVSTLVFASMDFIWALPTAATTSRTYYLGQVRILSFNDIYQCAR